MADNQITIRLNADTSSFTSSMAQVQKTLGSLGTDSAPMRRELKATANQFGNDIQRSLSYGISMLRGNLSSFNISGFAQSIGAAGKSASSAARGALAGMQSRAVVSQLPEIGGSAGILTAVSGIGAQIAGAIGAALGNVVGAIIGATAVLGLIAAGVAVMTVGMSAVQTAVNPILKMLTAIGKVLGAALMPIALVVVQMLQPLIWLLMPFVTMMNAIFRPLRSAIASFFKSSGEALKTGDVGALVGGLFSAIVPTLAALGESISGIIMPLFARLAAWVYDFLTMDIASVKNTLGNLIGTDLAAVVSALIGMLHFAVSGVSGFVGQLMGKENFDKLLGSGAFDNLSKTNSAFSGGVGVAEALQTLVSAIVTFAELLAGGNFKEALQFAASLLVVGFTAAVLGIVDAAKFLIDGMIKANNPVLNGIMQAGIFLAQGMLQIAMTTIPSLVTSFQRLALGANSFIAGLAVTAEELKWRIGHGSNEGLAEAYHQASKAKLEQDTYTPATSKSVYGSLSASMNTLYVGLDKLSEDLEKGDINAALADNATAFATLKTGIIGVSDAILTRIITPQTVPNFKTSIDGVSTASKTWAADMNAFNPASYMRSAIDGLVSLIRSEVAAAKEAAESSADTANDFILAPGGRLIKTNPADYLFGTTDPNGMRGGTVNNFGGITIHVSGQSDTRELVREISKELQSELRARINYGSG